MHGERTDRWLTLAGSILVGLGVAVWGVYAVVRWGLDGDVTGRQFLPYHLAGVVPGMVLRRRRFLKRLFLKAVNRNENEDRLT